MSPITSLAELIEGLDQPVVPWAASMNYTGALGWRCLGCSQLGVWRNDAETQEIIAQHNANCRRPTHAGGPQMIMFACHVCRSVAVSCTEDRAVMLGGVAIQRACNGCGLLSDMINDKVVRAALALGGKPQLVLDLPDWKDYAMTIYREEDLSPEDLGEIYAEGLDGEE